MIYETKGLTLEEIDELYDEVTVARRSVGWRPKTTFREIRASVAAQGGRGPSVAGQGGMTQRHVQGGEPHVLTDEEKLGNGHGVGNGTEYRNERAGV